VHVALQSHVRAGAAVATFLGPEGGAGMVRAAALCVVIALAGLPTPVRAEGAALEVVLLGTGGPAPLIDRFGPATLVRAGSEYLLFDAGRGASQRIWQTRLPLGSITAVFLTHLHSDHVVGLPDLWLTSWLPTAFGARTAPLQVFGPAGTRDMTAALQNAFRWDIRARTGGEEQVAKEISFHATDIGEGVVLERNGVKVTAFTVDHAKHLRPALGYRVDHGGHSVVISGDTRPSDNLVRFAERADVVVHEVFAATERLLRDSAVARSVGSYHTSPEEAGRVFARVKPRLAVFTHVIQFRLDSAAPPSVEDILARTRSAYSGPLVVGEDLMTIAIGAEVEVRPPAR
jgi:ribonuclease Z